MLLSCRSSRIFALRACSSGLRFFLLLIVKTSNVVLLFYTTSEVYTIFGMVSHPLILFNRDSVQSQLLKQSFHALGVQPRIIMHCSQITTTQKFVRQGKCGCFFFSSLLPFVPDLIGIPVTPEIPVKVGLVWKKGKYISNSTRAFIRFCERYYSSEIN